MVFEPTISGIQTNPSIGVRGLIDIFLPDETNKSPIPFILGIHGGGWQNGDRTSYSHFWPDFKKHGLGLVLCSYRLGSLAPFPAAINDVMHVIKWVHENINQILCSSVVQREDILPC
jgi:acetyl esterase/lipase